MFFKNKLYNTKVSNEYSKKTFSQTGEDIIVKFIFDAIDMPKPSYLDIGAHHPFYLSNTALLYENGCRGINIEPDPILFSKFIEHRNEDVNLNFGVSDIESESDFFIINVPTLNTFSREEALRYCEKGEYKIKEVKKIQTKTISNVIATYAGNKFPEFLTLDAEGIDDLVLNSIDYESNFPLVICVETISFSESKQGRKNEKMIQFLIEKGYFLYADTHINSIFVRREIWK